MYLAEVRAGNFRIYGPAPQGLGEGVDTSVHVVFGPGLSVLVGENDSEKSAVIDAIRLCLTSSADYFRVTADDIPCGPVTGEKVIRRNHLGDSGTQFGMFI